MCKVAYRSAVILSRMKHGGRKQLSVVRGPLSVAKKEKSRGHFKISECGYRIADLKKQAGGRAIWVRWVRRHLGECLWTPTSADELHLKQYYQSSSSSSSLPHWGILQAEPTARMTHKMSKGLLIEPISEINKLIVFPESIDMRSAISTP